MFTGLNILKSFEKTVTLTCSITGDTTLTDTMVDDGSLTLPAWTSLVSSNETLMMSTPSVSGSQTYSFNITTTDGFNSWRKNIQITVSE